MVTREMIEEQALTAAAEAEKLVLLRKSFAKQECPFNIGDIVDCIGFSHRGKQMVVNHITPAKHSFDGYWRVAGKVLNSDGNEGKLTAEFSHRHYKESMED